MSDDRTMQWNLKKISDMMPLTEREAKIAQMMFSFKTSPDPEDEAQWYGEEAMEAYKHIWAEGDDT